MLNELGVCLDESAPLSGELVLNELGVGLDESAPLSGELVLALYNVRGSQGKDNMLGAVKYTYPFPLSAANERLLF